VLKVASLIVAPALFWLCYHHYKDRVQPEPLLHLGISYLLGVVAGYLCFHGYELAGVYGMEEGINLKFFFYCLIVVGLIEELAKFLPFWQVCMRFRRFDEPIDGIIYASAVALGFASYENIKYMEFMQGREMFARAIASPLTHCMFASIWGYSAGRARLDGRPLLRPMLIGLSLAALAHGLYDFVAVALHPYLRPVTAAIILVIWIWRLKLIRRLHDRQFAEAAKRPRSSKDPQRD
jgi:RsiW-degrading membrane proteinase PrsW (M82 family)